MTKKMIVYDAGNAFANTVWRSFTVRRDGRIDASALQVIDEPTQYAVIPEGLVHADTNTGFEIDYNYVGFNGSRFVMGHDAIASGLPTNDVKGSDRYGNDAWWAMINYVIGRVCNDGDDLFILLFAPPDYHQHTAQIVREQMVDNDNTRTVYFNGSPIKVNVLMKGVMPEGAAAAAAYMYDTNGRRLDETPLAGNNKSVFIDIGAFTLDTASMIGARWQRQAVQRATDDTLGFYTNMVMPIYQYARKQGYNWVYPNLIEQMFINAVVDVTKTGVLRYVLPQRGFMDGPDLTDVVQDQLLLYYHKIKNRLSPQFNNFDTYNNLFLLGGGAWHLYKHFEADYEVILQPYDDHLPFHLINVIGASSWFIRKIWERYNNG